MTNPLPNLTHDADGWPSYWPYLTADDMHQGDYSDDSGMRCCLVQWMGQVAARQAFDRVCSMLQIECLVACGIDSIAKANDRCLTRSQAAAIWNRVGEQLGYTEDGWEEV